MSDVDLTQDYLEASNKLIKLSEFINNYDVFSLLPPKEQRLLANQEEALQNYVESLQHRIDNI